MTVEIKQLVIRAVVEQPRDEPRAGARVDPARTEQDAVIAPDADALVSRCVREVLRALEHRRGR